MSFGFSALAICFESFATLRRSSTGTGKGTWPVAGTHKGKRKGTRKGTGEDHLAGATGGKEAKRWQVPQADPGGGEC